MAAAAMRKAKLIQANALRVKADADAAESSKEQQVVVAVAAPAPKDEPIIPYPFELTRNPFPEELEVLATKRASAALKRADAYEKSQAVLVPAIVDEDGNELVSCLKESALARHILGAC